MDYQTREKTIYENSSPLVSIIVPIYNIEKYISKCIESIIKQTYTNIEIILVDDASLDRCGEICDKFAEDDNRIRVIHKEKNEGLVAARKTGMNIAKGDLIGCVDGDDWIDVDFYEKMVFHYLIDDSDVVQSGYVENGGKSRKYSWNEKTYEIGEAEQNNIIRTWLLNENVILGSQIWTKLYKREMFIEGYNKVPNHMSSGEDYIFFINLVKIIKKITLISDAGYHYRISNASMSHKKDGIQLLVKEDTLSNYLIPSISNLYPKISKDLLENWYLQRKMLHLKSTLKQYGVDLPVYRYCEFEKLFDKRIVIYGAGNVGIDFLKQLSVYDKIDISGWVDQNYQNYQYDFREVKAVEEIRYLQWDYILVAVWDIKIAEQIKNALVKDYGIPEAYILWNYCRKLKFEKR